MTSETMLIEPGSRSDTLERQTVLVVEHDEVIRELLREVLGEDGYAVLEAKGGAQALELLEEHVPSVILLDHHLLDVSSLEVLEQLRAYEPVYHIPVMLLSGLAHQLAGVDHGADRILSKPFDITDLLGQLYSLANDARVIDS